MIKNSIKSTLVVLMLLGVFTSLAVASSDETVTVKGDQSSINITLYPEGNKLNADNSETEIDSMDSVIILTGSSEMDVTGSRIDFSTSSFVIPSVTVPLIQATSELWYKDANGNQAFKIAAFDSNTYATSAEAEGFYIATQSGYYRVVGTHYIQSPAGYTPPEAEDTTYTDWEYISV